jgi:predicted PurR-regulated permease PerM
MAKIKSHIYAVLLYTFIGVVVGGIVGFFLSIPLWKACIISLCVVLSMHYINFIVLIIAEKMNKYAKKTV